MKAKDKRGKIIVRLTRSDIVYLRRIVRSGTRSAQVITRARVLLMSHQGKRNWEIIDALGCTHFAIADIRQRFVTRKKDVAAAIIDAPRPGQPRRILPEHEAYVVATACTDPPEGHAHWTLPELKKALLAAYQTIRTVSDERIRQTLLAHELKPWREKNVVRTKAHANLP